MAISIKKYIDITSGVGAGVSVRTKDMILRLYTKSQFMPTNTVIEMTESQEVGDFFGYDSEEYKRALFYFGYISKSIKKPRKISFYRDSTEDIPTGIFGTKDDRNFQTFKEFTASKIVFISKGEPVEITLDLEDVVNLGEVATVIKTALNETTDDILKVANVVWNATRKSFDLGSAEFGSLEIDFTLSDVELLNALGWNARAIYIEGMEGQSHLECLDTSVDISTNFATFIFMDKTISLDTNILIANWNKARNNEFAFVVTVTQILSSTWAEKLNPIGGVSLVLAGDDLQDMALPCMTASIDFEAENGTINTMYQSFNLNPTVTVTADASYYDNLKINYYGQTQKAGQKIAFYQDGVMCGGATDPQSENVYINEIWFKDYLISRILGAFLNLEKISWNLEGRAILISTLEDGIKLAKKNGVISVGKPLNIDQKSYIAQITGDSEAWRKVYNEGYWLDIDLRTETGTNGVTKHIANYVLLYSKDDVIRKVIGSDILI